MITSCTVVNNSYLGKQKYINTSSESGKRVWTANTNLKTSKADANTDIKDFLIADIFPRPLLSLAGSIVYVIESAECGVVIESLIINIPTQLVIETARSVDVELEPNDIPIAHGLPSKNSQRQRNIIVKLKSSMRARIWP